MAVLTDSLLVDLLAAVAFGALLFYLYITGNDDYWDKRSVRNVKRGIFLRSLMGVQSQNDNVQEIYNQFSGERYGGLFQGTRPILMIRDPELILRVLVKDFSHFQDRGNPEIKNDPVFSYNLSALKGQTWKAMRNKLTPTFTTGKLRGMFEQVANSGANLLRRVERASEEKSEVESKDFVSNFTMDVISSCAFGLEFLPGTKEFEVFKKHVMGLFKASFTTFARIILNTFFPKVTNLINLGAFPADSCNYFVNLVKATIKYRKENSYTRNDYLQLLITLKEQEDGGKSMMGLPMDDVTEDDDVITGQIEHDDATTQMPSNVKLFTDESITANSIIFLTAGSDGTSSAISIALYELCRHPDEQRRVQREVDVVLAAHKGVWSYQAVRDMTYLEQVIQGDVIGNGGIMGTLETQRMYPNNSVLQRECTKPYKVPDSDLVIEKGVLVHIPVIGLHKDPQHYPEPELFKPERFEGNNFKPNATFLPFGDGPRICIAMRFAIMEIKACVAQIMAEYSVKLSPKTKLPLEFNPRSFVITPKHGIYVSFEKREKK